MEHKVQTFVWDSWSIHVFDFVRTSISEQAGKEDRYALHCSYAGDIPKHCYDQKGLMSSYSLGEVLWRNCSIMWMLTGKLELKPKWYNTELHLFKKNYRLTELSGLLRVFLLSKAEGQIKQMFCNNKRFQSIIDNSQQQNNSELWTYF